MLLQLGGASQEVLPTENYKSKRQIKMANKCHQIIQLASHKIIQAQIYITIPWLMYNNPNKIKYPKWVAVDWNNKYITYSKYWPPPGVTTARSDHRQINDHRQVSAMSADNMRVLATMSCEQMTTGLCTSSSHKSLRVQDSWDLGQNSSTEDPNNSPI